MRMSDVEIVERVVLAMVGEGARAFEDRVVATPAEFDLATVFGTGFAPFRGGLLKYVDSVGAANICERMDAHRAMADVAERGDGAQRFEPADILRRLAEEGGTFHGLKDSPA